MTIVKRLMAWCVPDEALRRKRHLSMLEASKILDRVVAESPGLSTMIDLRYDYGQVHIPASWTVGQEG